MAVLIQAENLSLAWLKTLDYLVNQCEDGKAPNVTAAIQVPGIEHAGIARALDRFLKARDDQPITTIANTIFPQKLYHPELGLLASTHLYTEYRTGSSVRRRHRANRFGTYFDRLIDWPLANGTFNQLDRIIDVLRKQRGLSNPKSSIYELGVVAAGESGSEELESEGSSADMRIYDPGKDRRVMGFPCLCHISLTLHSGQLHMAALYRNQHFIRKAYGNLRGLGQLLRFLSHESGCAVGELLCVASHADAELALGKRAINDLIAECRAELKN